MAAYKYVVMRQRGTAIEMQCTDVATFHQLLGALVLWIDGWAISASKAPSGQVIHWRIIGLGDRLEEAWTLVFEHLEARGWQWLEGSQSSGSSHERVLYFGLGDED